MGELWDAWVGTETPAEVLRRVDREVRAGHFASRRDAFLDHARRVRHLLRPDADRVDLDTLARRLQDYAERSEEASP